MTLINADLFKKLSLFGPIFKEDGSFDIARYFSATELKPTLPEPPAFAYSIFENTAQLSQLPLSISGPTAQIGC
ncbi:hypothetical protein E4191_10140 [Paracoccus liaowanqingii]|uniref:Uncharacterized protein n=1 Tax=Paracoccus liaowanqingii TaxID=2560053 RepID=A0A4P7HNT1_9RHOB|nr:hypothetical protein [Paracoccus liaowanqingii]QBX35027.1 hypothetical protein E4191_10140 [Paracoccus liaowanqingii]